MKQIFDLQDTQNAQISSRINDKIIDYFDNDDVINNNNRINAKDSTNDNNFSDKYEIQCDRNVLDRKINIKSSDDKQIPVFTQRSSITFSLRDQFATALLRLQTDLDDTTRKMETFEARLDSLNKFFIANSAQKNVKKRGVSKLLDALPIMFYITWPLFLYVAMRFIERRGTTIEARKFNKL